MEDKEKVFIVPVHWSVAADIKIKAESEEEAIMIAESSHLPPHSEWEYIDDSFHVNKENITEEETIKKVSVLVDLEVYGKARDGELAQEIFSILRHWRNEYGFALRDEEAVVSIIGVSEQPYKGEES